MTDLNIKIKPPTTYIKPLTNYILINNPDGGHTGQTSTYITFRQAKKLLKDETIIVYIFKIPKCKCNNLMLKYPLCEYYKCLEINDYINDVWTSMNVTNIKDTKDTKDFNEYIELVPSHCEIDNEWKFEIKYHQL